MTQAVDRLCYQRVFVCSGDTDVFVSLMFTLKPDGNVKKLTSSGWSTGTKWVQFTIGYNLFGSVTCIIKFFQQFTGCDTTSKISTKASAFRVAKEHSKQYLKAFLMKELDHDLCLKVRHFLLNCLSKVPMYHKTSFKLDLEKIPPPLSIIHLHIQLAYLQCQLWVIAASKQLTLDPCDYGYKKVDKILFPLITLTNEPLHVDFPKPCKCLKCARPTICPCRQLNLLWVL